MHALVEENARGAVQLGHDDTFRTVDDEGSRRSHVGDVAQIDVLDAGVEIFVIRVGAGKAEFRLEGNVVGESAFKALFNRILRRVDEVVYELELVIVSGVLDGEYLLENLVEALVAAALRGGLQLEEVAEALKLNLEKIRIFQYFGRCEINAF